MSKNAFIVIGFIILGILASSFLSYFRAENLAIPSDIAIKGFENARRDLVIFYGFTIPVVVGFSSYYIYKHMFTKNSQTAPMTFLLLAAGIGIILTMFAGLVFGTRSFYELTGLHVICVVLYGWLMPKILKF